MISWLCSLMVIISLIKADPVLRYNLSSCNTLEPVYVEENWQQGMMGGDLGDQEELFDIPRRSRQRNPPFEIQIDFDQYRRNRKYTGATNNQKYSLQFLTILLFSVRIVATENQYFDSFLLQARGTNQLDGNATLVGSFIKPWPSISRYVYPLCSLNIIIDLQTSSLPLPTKLQHDRHRTTCPATEPHICLDVTKCRLWSDPVHCLSGVK